MVITERTAAVTGTILRAGYWSCAGGLSALNAIGTQWRNLINSGLTRWRIDKVDAVVESGRNPSSKHKIKIQPLGFENEQADGGRDGPTCLARLAFQTLTGTVGEKNVFPVQLAMSSIGNIARLIHALTLLNTHTYFYAVVSREKLSLQGVFWDTCCKQVKQIIKTCKSCLW